jgi:hypothetical protein
MRRSQVRHSFILIVLGLLGASQVLADDQRGGDDDDHLTCTAYNGPFSSVTGPPCTSPINLCTHGQLGPDFPAQYDFTFNTLDSANDPNDPTKFVYTGVSVVTPADNSGVLYTNDTGVIHIPQDGAPAPFVTKAIVDRGTKQYKKASGGFVATGNLVFESGQATGSFSAVLCGVKPDRGGHH